MKKIVLLLFIIGCENPTHKPLVIAKYKHEGYCNYYYDGLGRIGQPFDDPCDKYSIGDTIK